MQVTIVPRGSGALGFAQYLPKEVMLSTEQQINDMICMALAGRAAEEVQFGKVTTGASNDLHKVTQLIYQMIQVYGFNPRIGQLAFPPENNGGFPPEKKYSDATAQKMDEEAKLMVDAAYARTLELMVEKKEQARLVFSGRVPIHLFLLISALCFVLCRPSHCVVWCNAARCPCILDNGQPV